MQESEGFLSRRDVIRGAVGATAVGTVAAEPAVAQDGTIHTVDMTDQLVFDPDELTIAPGDTVVWENVGTIGHSVTAYEEEIPEDAEFFASGGLESEQAARDSYPSEGDVPGGESYQHSFEVEGEYGYFCIPHEAVGMVGTLTVTTEQREDGGGAAAPTVPTSAISIGIAASAALLTALSLTYVFLKYGGDYPETGTE
jgi:plastocyanin